MPKNDPPLRFPVRGVPGGWRDPWDGDDARQLRAHAEAAARELEARARRLGRAWRAEIAAERGVSRRKGA